MPVGADRLARTGSVVAQVLSGGWPIDDLDGSPVADLENDAIAERPAQLRDRAALSGKAQAGSAC